MPSLNRPKPLVLVIMDGIGATQDTVGNAVTKAKTPMLNKLWSAFPHGYLEASSAAVGLPDDTRGNSEVGHTNIGAGKVVLQDLPRINRSIDNGTFYSNITISQAIQNAKEKGSALHLMGLASNGNVHSSIDHLFAILESVKQKGVKIPVYIHAFTDGRDTPPTQAMLFINQIIKKTQDLGIGQLASVVGRYYAMDRNDKWDRTELAYNLLLNGEGQKCRLEELAKEIERSYARKETDEFIKPISIVNESGEQFGKISDNDSVIFFNYRPDRAIQLSQAITLPDFSFFKRKAIAKNLLFVGMTDYSPDLPILTAFPADDVVMPFGRLVAENGLRQLRIAESEKFPHVTYFFNGGRDMKFEGEDRIEVRSPDVATYDLKPEMSAHEMTEILLEKIRLNIYDFILVNYANGDMVGHTGNLQAGIKAVETVDFSLRRLIPEVLRHDGELLITADHGNVEEMINLETKQIDTQHSLFPVPLVHVSRNPRPRQLQYGILGDIAPTAASILKLDTPDDMTGQNLLK